MKDFNVQKNNAKKLREEKKYSEAVIIYKDLLSENESECTEWEKWGYAFCLKQMKKYHEALEVSEKLYNEKPDFNYNNSVLGWCIYYLDISIPEITDENKFLKAAEKIIKVSSQDGNYSPYTITVFKVIDYLQNKNQVRPEVIKEWLTKLNPEKLNKDGKSITDHTGKLRELASDFEKWHSINAKILFETSNYIECITFCNKTLQMIGKFHHDNQVWLNRLIGLSNFRLGKKEQALEILKEVLKKKKDWFIQKEIAEILFSLENYKEAIRYASLSALNLGTCEKKINLFHLMFDILIKLNESALAKKHLQLILQIRKENKWNIDHDLLTELNKYEIEMNSVIPVKDIINDLTNCWKNHSLSGQKSYTGRITKILQNGNSGFIEAEDKNSYYFRFNSFNGNHRSIQHGLEVIFYLEDGIDPKNNKPSLSAVNISIKE